jgi:hypothetical protein
LTAKSFLTPRLKRKTPRRQKYKPIKTDTAEKVIATKTPAADNKTTTGVV